MAGARTHIFKPQTQVQVLALEALAMCQSPCDKIEIRPPHGVAVKRSQHEEFRTTNNGPVCTWMGILGRTKAKQPDQKHYTSEDTESKQVARVFLRSLGKFICVESFGHKQSFLWD